MGCEPNKTSILDLPNEVILLIASELKKQSELNSLAQVSPRFYFLLNRSIYRKALQKKNPVMTWAVNYRRPGTIQNTILFGGDIVSLPEQCPTILARAARNGTEEIVKNLVSYKWIEVDRMEKLQIASYARTPLMWAAWRGSLPIVQMLLNTRRVKPNAKDERMRSAISYAAAEGHYSVVSRLLKIKGLDIDDPDINGWTPLARAAGRGHIEVVQLLLSTKRVSVNSLDKERSTPISKASKYGWHDVAETLQLQEVV